MFDGTVTLCVILLGVPIPIALTNPSTSIPSAKSMLLVPDNVPTLILLNEPVKPVIIPLALMSPEAVICPAGPLIVTVLDPNLVVPPII